MSFVHLRNVKRLTWLKAERTCIGKWENGKSCWISIEESWRAQKTGKGFRCLIGARSGEIKAVFKAYLSGVHVQERLGQGLMYPPKNEHGGRSDNEETEQTWGTRWKKLVDKLSVRDIRSEWRQGFKLRTWEERGKKSWYWWQRYQNEDG